RRADGGGRGTESVIQTSSLVLVVLGGLVWQRGAGAEELVVRAPDEHRVAEDGGSDVHNLGQGVDGLFVRIEAETGAREILPALTKQGADERYAAFHQVAHLHRDC